MTASDASDAYKLAFGVSVPTMSEEHRSIIDRHIRAAVLGAAEIRETGTRRYLHDVAEQGVRAMLALAGENPARPGLVDTPARVVAAFLEMCDRPGDPAELLARTFPDIAPPADTITVGPIPFVSMCEHHLLPFTGHAWVGYRPLARVVGLSKLPRLVAHYARRPQVQERLTEQICEAVETYLEPAGTGVRITGAHSCMTLRGIECDGAGMVTTALRGQLVDDPYRREFLDLTNRGG